MRIALLTIWHEKNFGAELQAYATVKVLSDMGHDVRMIDIRLSDKNGRSLKSYLVDLIEVISPANRKFEKFWHKYIPTTKRYRSVAELQTDPPEADIYMVGSDQVWNPKITEGFQQLYFLNFGKPEVRRISYASSFGQTDIAFENEQKIKALLQSFQAVSCREKSGVDILSCRFGICARHVLDPCFLVDSYSNFVKNTKSIGTLCYYPLSEDKDLEIFSKRLADNLGLKAVNMNRTTKALKKILWDKPGIEDWLNNIAHSNFVITRSFHGVVFSILFNKQFAVVVGRKDRLTRIESLLQLFNLEHRLFKSLQELEAAKPWEHNIDYAPVNTEVERLRTVSRIYLQDIISKPAI